MPDTTVPPIPPPYPPAPPSAGTRELASGAGMPSSPLRSIVPLIVTVPEASQKTGPVRILFDSLSVTPAAMLIVVKLKMLSPAGLRGGVNDLGSK